MIYIIIPVFNRIESTKKCLESLMIQTLNNYQIIVVDDGSTDGTSDMVQRDFPNVHIVTGTGNWWWTKSTNEGILSILPEAKKDDLILTLNNDLVVSPDYLQTLMDTYQMHKPCMVGSVSLWNDNPEKIEFAGVTWSPWNAKYRFNSEKESSYTELIRQKSFIHTDLLPGRGTLYCVELVERIGLYDEKHFPQYAADEDFSLRAKKAGYSLLISTQSRVFSNVTDTGINFRYDKPSFKKFVQSLYSIRSANNLKVRFFFALKHGKIPPLYFALDVGRIFGSFVKKYLHTLRHSDR